MEKKHENYRRSAFVFGGIPAMLGFITYYLITLKAKVNNPIMLEEQKAQLLPTKFLMPYPVFLQISFFHF